LHLFALLPSKTRHVPSVNDLCSIRSCVFCQSIPLQLSRSRVGIHLLLECASQRTRRLQCTSGPLPCTPGNPSLRESVSSTKTSTMHPLGRFHVPYSPAVSLHPSLQGAVRMSFRWCPISGGMGGRVGIQTRDRPKVMFELSPFVKNELTLVLKDKKS